VSADCKQLKTTHLKFSLMKGLIEADYNLKDKDEARSFFSELISLVG